MSNPEQQSIFSDELQTLLAYSQHPMAQQFRSLVVEALKQQEASGGRRKHISFPCEHMLEIAGEIDCLLEIIKSLAEVVAKQTSFLDDQKQNKKEYLS